MQVIYCRVSTETQTVENQATELKESYPHAAVVVEKASGIKERPELKALLERLQKGDELIVYALDRLGRRTSEVLTLIESLEKRGVILKTKREGVDYSTICGKLVTQVLCAVAEMERNMISERTKLALKARKAKGVKLGSPKKYGPEVVERIKQLRSENKSYAEIAKETGVSAARICQLLK